MSTYFLIRYGLVNYWHLKLDHPVYSRKSTTGYIIKICGGPVAWCSERQPIVSLSSTEAEYIAAAECIKEAFVFKVSYRWAFGSKYCYDFPVGSHKVSLTQQLINLLTLQNTPYNN